MKKYFKQLLVGAFLLVSSFVAVTPVAAEDVFERACTTNANSAVCQSRTEGVTREDAGQRVQVVINTILMVLGIVAVIVIIISGFRYVISNGDESGVKQGKDAILYAVIGLIVAMLAFVIVNFFVFSFTTP